MTEFISEENNEGYIVSVNAILEEEVLKINFEAKSKAKEHTGTVELTKDQTTNTLKSRLELTKDEMNSNPIYQKVYKLIPLWGVEATGELDEMLKYNKDDKAVIPFLQSIFDKCYIQEMGVCYSDSNSNISTTLIGEIEMNNKSALYALKTLDEKYGGNNSLIIVGAVALIIVFLISISAFSKKK